MTSNEAINILLNAYNYEVQKGGRGCGKTAFKTALLIGVNAINAVQQATNNNNDTEDKHIMNRRIFLRKVMQNKNFFFLLAKHLDEIFDNDWYYFEEDIPDFDINIGVVSTVGWGGAIRKVMKELDLIDCFQYYNALDWRSSDELDGVLETLITSIIFDNNGNRIYE